MDAGVAWVQQIAEQITLEEGFVLRVACLFSELQPGQAEKLRSAGRVRPRGPAGLLDAATLARCSHVVGLMGHEPIAAAAPVWHGAKIAECGGLCTTNPRSGRVLVTFDETGFRVSRSWTWTSPEKAAAVPDPSANPAASRGNTAVPTPLPLPQQQPQPQRVTQQPSVESQSLTTWT